MMTVAWQRKLKKMALNRVIIHYLSTDLPTNANTSTVSEPTCTAADVLSDFIFFDAFIQHKMSESFNWW